MEYINRMNCNSCLIPKHEPVQQEEVDKPEVKQEVSACKTFKVKAISCVNNKIIITFDDCTYIEADPDVVDVSVAKEILMEMRNDVNTLISNVNHLFGFKQELELKLINIEDSNGNVIFQAIKAEDRA